MSGMLIETLLAFAMGWSWLVWCWKFDVERSPTSTSTASNQFGLFYGGLLAITVLTGTASVVWNVALLWLCWAGHLVVTAMLARLIPDPAPLIIDHAEAAPPVLWKRCQAAVIASGVCGTLGLLLLVVVSGRWDLTEISAALQPILQPTHSFGGVPHRVLIVRAAVVLILVGTGLSTFTSPLHLAAFEMLRLWPGAIAGWWLTMTRLLGLTVVWRIVQATYSGLESTIAAVAVALGVLSLVHGTISLWQSCSLRSYVARLMLLQSGLCWLAVAAEIVKPAGGVDFWQGGFDWISISWCGSSLAMLVLLGVEQSLCKTNQRLDFFDQLTGLKQHHPVATWCLLIGGLSLTLMPPLPQFWSCFTLIMGVLTPGRAVIEHAGLMPHPAIVLGLVIAATCLVASTVRTIGLLSPLVFDESLGGQHFDRRRNALAIAVVGGVLLVVAGVMPRL